MDECNESQVQASLNDKTIQRSYSQDSTVNISQTENSGNNSVTKRPRGRPRAEKKSLGFSGPKSNNWEKSYEKEDSLNTSSIVKRSRGRPKLIKRIVGCSEIDIQKRGKGRPKGSRNKKRARSLDENFLVKNTRKNQNLTTNSIGDSASPNRNDVKSISNTNQSISQMEHRENSLPLTCEKRGRGRPPGAKNRPKLNPKDRKLSKKKLKQLRREEANSNIRNIPKERFEEALEMLNNDKHSIWEEKNGSCNKSIHRHWDEYLNIPSDHNIRLKFARQFLLRRDWVNLSKVLSISLQDYRTTDNSFFTLYTKYAAICLAHTDKQHFNKFLQYLLKTETDGEKVLKKCTQVLSNLSEDE